MGFITTEMGVITVVTRISGGMAHQFHGDVPVVNAQFAVRASQMPADGFAGDEEALGNLAVVHSDSVSRLGRRPGRVVELQGDAKHRGSVRRRWRS